MVLNTKKTKEFIVDFRRSKKTTHFPLHINGEEVERVNDIKFLGVYIMKDLTWSINTSHLAKKAQQRLFFLRKTKQARLSTQLLVNFYHCIIESVLAYGIIVWYASCTGENRRELCRVVKTAQRIIGPELPSLDTVYVSRLRTKASSIIVDHTHPGYRMFVPLPSGKRYRVLKSRTNRLKNSFFAKAVSVLTPPITTSIPPQ